MNLKLYRTLQTILSSLIFIYLQYRKFIGKEHKTRFPERKGIASVARPHGALIWVHAASVGESVSVVPLINAIIEKYPAINILITTGTVTSAKLLEKKLPKKVIHQFVPVDKLSYVKKFLSHWQPEMALWVESEIWPNLIAETSKSGCSIALVNARMSEATVQKWKKYNKFAEEIFSCFSICLAQNEEEAGKYIIAGIDNSVNAGNLKFESPALFSDPIETGKLITKIGKRHVWLAASTSSGEEEMAAFVHKKLSAKYPDLLTIIAPRHPNRAKEIASVLKDNHLTFAKRSDGDEIEIETQVYLADTIGELGIFYHIAGVVFMGGSLVEHGGQNPLEPARLDCAIITGDIVYNFKDVYAEMLLNDAVIMVKDKNELAEKVEILLSDKKLQDKLASNAGHFIQSKTGILNNYMQNLDPYLKPLIRA